MVKSMVFTLAGLEWRVEKENGIRVRFSVQARIGEFVQIRGYVIAARYHAGLELVGVRDVATDVRDLIAADRLRFPTRFVEVNGDLIYRLEKISEMFFDF